MTKLLNSDGTLLLKPFWFRITHFFLVSHSLELRVNLILFLQAGVSGMWVQIASALHALLLFFHCFRIQSFSETGSKDAARLPGEDQVLPACGLTGSRN